MTTNGETRNEVTTMIAIQNLSKSVSEIKNNTLTLRDQFAIAALSIYAGSNLDDDRVAQGCYKLADAMLKARDKK